MPRFRAPNLLVVCVVLAMSVLSPALAGTKSPLVGKNRAQVVEQLGEPKSNIRAGAREMLFFAKVKLTLRNDVVIEVEDLPEELPPAPKRPVETTAATPAQPAAQTAAPPTPAAPTQPTAGTGEDASPAAPPAKAAEVAPKPAKPPEPALSIKFIKSGSGGAKAAPQASAAPAAAPTPARPAAEVAPTPAAAVAKPVAGEAVPAAAPEANKTTAESKSVAAAIPPKTGSAAAGEEPQATAVTDTPAPEASMAKAPPDQKKRKASIMAKLRNRWRVRRDIETEDNSVQFFTGTSYLLAGVVIVGGIAFLWWRRSQRALALEASAVSRSPFPAVVGDPSAMFSNEQIGRLGQKKFERLVAAYYMKTGVVAECTNAGPTAPVHIKIFWKGEQKPFAGVQCHANPPALIPSRPLEDLFAALNAADIRRGYVVTTGKFSVEARDFAAEKVFTLLTGDMFLEKLNALPPAARLELLKETNAEESKPTA